MKQDLDVAPAAERVPFRKKLITKLTVIIDFAIADQHKRAVFVKLRLVAGFEVNDAKPAKPKAQVLLDVKSAGVRPTMDQCARHLFQNAPLNPALLAQIQQSNQSTRLCSLLSSCSWGDRIRVASMRFQDLIEGAELQQPVSVFSPGKRRNRFVAAGCHFDEHGLKLVQYPGDRFVRESAG